MELRNQSYFDLARKIKASRVVPALAGNPEVTYTNCSGGGYNYFDAQGRDGDKPLLDLVIPELEESTSPRASGLENSGPMIRPLGLQLKRLRAVDH